MRVTGKFKKTDHHFDVEINGLDVVNSETQPEARLIEMELRAMSKSGLVVSIPGVYTGPVRAERESSVVAGLLDFLDVHEITGRDPSPPPRPGEVY